MKRLFLSLLLSTTIFLTSCDSVFYTTPDVTISINKTEFSYGETIDVEITVNADPGKVINILWELKKDDLPQSITIDDPYSFSFTLTPDVTSDYTIRATISDGVETIVVDESFIVKQLPFLGTWKATNVNSPIGMVDIVGIWYINGYELYYFDANGGADILDHSSKGSMTFPIENSWITLDADYYWDTDGWYYDDMIYNARYNFVNDESHMTVEMGSYSWDFIKIDDTVDPWY